MFEYGEEGANSPQDCIMTTVPLSIVLQACENPDEKLTINFPDNLCKVEYSAAGTDAIKLKISMESLATTQVLLNDGITSVLSAVVCTLENYVPELKPGGINMLDPLPVAAFSADVTTGTAPLTVQFTDASIGEDLIYDWDFGDEGSSEVASPEHIYSSAGTYTVTLTVSNKNGEDVEEKVDYITVSE
jgi:PKD repeat protein